MVLLSKNLTKNITKNGSPTMAWKIVNLTKTQTSDMSRQVHMWQSENVEFPSTSRNNECDYVYIYFAVNVLKTYFSKLTKFLLA